MCLCVCLCVCVCVCVCVNVCVSMCVSRGDMRAPFIRRDKVPSFLSVILVGLGKP